MTLFKNLVGEKINNWTMLGFKKFDKQGEPMWIARCNCENQTVDIRRLSSFKRFGKCGKCVNREKTEKTKLERIGKKYGKLTIVDYYGYRNDVVTKSPFWIAKCDCGSEKDIIATFHDIKNKRVLSCGCLQREYSRKFGKINGSKRKKYNSFIKKEDYYIGISNDKEFIFDKEDYNKIIKINKFWSINSLNYVLCYIKRKEYQLHRYIMGLGFYNPKEDIIVDHINGDTLDNRKENLRIIHRRHNAKNTVIYSNNTSGYKGVSWHKHRQKWQANINVNKKNIYLGIYDKLEEAVEARKKAEIKYFGEFSRDYYDEVVN